MSKVLVIGAGGVGSVAVHKMAMNADIFSDVHLASRTKSKCDAIAESVRQRTGEAVSRRELLAACGEAGSLGARAVDSRVCRLRSRLGELGGPKVLTLRGRGYMLSVEARAA